MNFVDRIEIPSPFHIGRVNCYLFDSDELTLIDPGPDADNAYDVLCAHLEDRGYSVEDVDRILVTHPHMDHFGLASRIRDASGATVHAHPDAVEVLDDPDGHLKKQQMFFDPYFARMGVPEDAVDSVMSLPMSFTEFQKPVSVDETIQTGDHLDIGADVEVLDTPGHAPGSVCFVIPEADCVYSGDHVMSAISPNPLLTLRPGTTDERTRSLPTYIDSLHRLRDAGVGVAYGGHRAPVTDLPARIDEVIDHHGERKRRIAAFLEENGPQTAYELMNELFPDLPMTEVFPGMSEVIGHLDLLEDKGAVVRTGDEQWLYELT